MSCTVVSDSVRFPDSHPLSILLTKLATGVSGERGVRGESNCVRADTGACGQDGGFREFGNVLAC